MWKRTITLTKLNEFSQHSMAGFLGIEVTHIDANKLIATMPVNEKTKQPFGLLHGGASVVLAETLGSLAGYLMTEDNQQVVGVEINANHLRAVKQGIVRAECSAIHCGQQQQVWQIKIYNDDNQLCCISRLTTAVLAIRR